MTNQIGIVLVVLLGSACMSTTQTARHARAPLLLGPVSCVGCPARTAPAPTTPPTLEDASSVYAWGLQTGYVTSGGVGGTPSELDIKMGKITDPCRQEVVLRDILVGSFSVDTLVYWHSSSSVEVTGDHRVVPTGSCDMSVVRWPLAGPQGIRWPNPPQPVAPPAPAPTAPAVPPVPTALRNGG